MKCIHCQANNPATVRFCLNCGSPLISHCANCQMELPTGARFCMNCGMPVLDRKMVNEERIINFAATAPAPLVKKVHDAARLSGERRTVTAMFVDIIDSTALAEHVGASEWARILNSTCDFSCSLIYRYEGTIAKMHGDELLAFFGAPVAHEDDPVRAVHAALELLESFQEYAKGIHDEYGLDFGVRISLSTGPVIIGPIDNDLNYEYSALGGTINAAAKIESTKQPMTVLVSEYTYRLVAPFFKFIDLGEFDVEDRSEVMKIYQVQGVKAHPERVIGPAGFESPMVGRETELASLLQLSQAVKAGLGRVVLVVGEPGIGKTRLISEWKQVVLEEISKPPLKWAEGQNYSYNLGQAYNLLINLLHSILGVPTGAGEPETRAALFNLMKDLYGSIEENVEDSPALGVYPYLGHLLSIKLEDLALERVRMLDPEGLRAQYLAAFRRLLQGLADRGPLIVVLENLQWADPSSIELLTNIITLISAIPVLFCLVSRPNRDAPGWKMINAARDVMGGRFNELAVGPLSESHSLQVVNNLLKSDVLPKEMRTAILSRAEGNPFFIEEVLQMLIDKGSISQKDGRWIVEGEIEVTNIPDNLHGLLLAHIDSLPEEVKRTLRVASVIGRQFSTSVLENVIGGEESGIWLMNHLGALESAGFMHVSQVTPELTYVFQSALVQEVAYNSLLEADRMKLHQAVGETLEKLYPDQFASLELGTRLGQHFLAAGDTQRAFKYFSLAGDAALASYANLEAESRYRKALTLARSDSERAPILFGLGKALVGQSHSEESIEIWREGIDLHRAISPENSDYVACLYAHSARAAWGGGNTPQSLALCQEGLKVVANASDSPGLALLIHEAARAYLFNGLVEEARRLCQQALDMAERLKIVNVQVDTLATMGLLPDQHPESALQALTKAVEIAESSELLSYAARAHTNLAALLVNRIQDFQTARDHYRRSAEIRRLMGSKAGELVGLGGVAEISLLLGDLDGTQATFPTLRQLLDEVTDPGPAVFHFRKIEALLLRYRGDLEDALQRLRILQIEERQRGNLQNLVEVNSQLAEILLESYAFQNNSEDRTLDEAEILLEEARMIIEGGLGNKEWLCCLMSMIRTHQGRLENAQYFLDEGYETNSQQSTPINRGWLSFAEAKLRTVEEDWTKALTAFDSALNTFTELQMRWWRARVLLDWAEMYEKRSKPADIEQALALLREALVSFDAMGATSYSELVKNKLLALETRSYSQALAHKKVAQEMAWAGELQRVFFPKELPQIPGWQVAVILQPARETSGDFYDFIRLPDGRWGIVIADVTDKGFGAALYMTLSHTLIRTFSREYPDQPELLLTAVNQRILADTPANLFVTAIYGILDPETGTFVYCNAGQNPPYLFSSGSANPTGMLHATGVPLGIFEDKLWKQDAVVIEPKSTLVLYSDGITEAQNPSGEFFGEERLVQIAGANIDRSAEDMKETIVLALREFVGKAPQSDDITLIVITRES